MRGARLAPTTAVHLIVIRLDGNQTGAAGVLWDVLTVAVLLLLLTLVSAAVWRLRPVWPPSAPVSFAPLARMLTAGWVLLVGLLVAASLSLLPFQLDRAGQQACAITRSGPGAEQREEAEVLARRSRVEGLREAAGPATSPSKGYHSVERWCSSND